MKEVVAGVDIGGTNTVSGLVDRSGNIIATEKLITTDYPEINDFISALSASINRMLSKEKGLQLLGIGIGAPNGNYYRGTIELAANLAWQGIIPFADLLRRRSTYLF